MSFPQPAECRWTRVDKPVRGCDSALRNRHVAAALRGRRGIIRISPGGTEAKVVVAGVNLVGLAFSSAGEMAVVSIDSVYSVPTQIKGTLLP